MKNLTLTVAVAWLFYDNLLFFIVLIPLFIIFLYEDIAKIKEQQSSEKLMEFQDLLTDISQSIQVGNSIEGSFINAAENLSKIHEKNSEVINSLYRLVYGLQMNVPIEKLVDSMAEQVNEEEVHLFASVFKGAVKSGADMVEVIAFAADNISEKIRSKREAEMIINSKKTEQSIMNLVPLAILLYIKLCSVEFIASLYHNLSGVLIMTFFLFLYLAAYFWSHKIMKIEV